MLALLGLVVFPLAMQALDQAFYIGFACRIMIYAIAASSLNLILGNGGMVSFGHAAFLGAGAYVVGIMMEEGIVSAWISWPVATSPPTAPSSKPCSRAVAAPPNGMWWP